MNPRVEPPSAVSSTEIVAERVMVHVGTIGPERFGRDVMIAASHIGHHPVLGSAPARVMDIMLTWEQVESLHRDLSDALNRRNA